MSFMFDDYSAMIELLRNNSYKIINYIEYGGYDKCVILRHDIDMDLNQALTAANLEFELGISSTYFLLLSGDLYNLFSKKSRKMVKEIEKLGHAIGLHFDESVYLEDMGNTDRIIKNIKKEAKIMSELLERDIKCFSYHRPSQTVLQANIEIEGLVNVYGKVFFHDFKYLSDSRMHWREPVSDIIKSGRYKKLHILTHPFWYHANRMEMKDIIFNYVSKGNIDRYNNMKDNITNLEDVLKDMR